MFVEWLQRISVTENRDGKFVSTRETIAVERKVIISWSDGQQILETTASPGQEQELALGLLATMGMLVPAEAVHVNQLDYITTVDIEQMRIYDQRRKAAPPLVIEMAEIEQGCLHLHELQVLRKKTGCAHGALIMEAGTERRLFAEDIRRQNALLKTIGLSKVYGCDPRQCIIFFTGRLTSETVTMAAHAMVPMMVSLAVATDAGIRIAQDADMTLIGSAGRWIYNIGAARIVP